MISGFIAALVVGIKVAEMLRMYLHVRIYTVCGLCDSIWNNFIKALEYVIGLMRTHTHTHTHTFYTIVCVHACVFY